MLRQTCWVVSVPSVFWPFRQWNAEGYDQKHEMNACPSTVLYLLAIMLLRGFEIQIRVHITDEAWLAHNQNAGFVDYEKRTKDSFLSFSASVLLLPLWEWGDFVARRALGSISEGIQLCDSFKEWKVTLKIPVCMCLVIYWSPRGSTWEYYWLFIKGQIHSFLLCFVLVWFVFFEVVMSLCSFSLVFHVYSNQNI